MRRKTLQNIVFTSTMPGMTLLSLSVAATATPPLEPDDVGDLAKALADRMGGQLGVVSHGNDDRDGSLSVLVLTEERDLARQAAAVLEHLAALTPAGHALRMEALEVLTQDAVDRRLGALGIPPPGAPLPVAGRSLPAVPEVVSARNFAELLGVTTQRIYDLESRRKAAQAQGRDVPFPKPYLRAMWLREDAERYRDSGRRPRGRPRQRPQT